MTADWLTHLGVYPGVTQQRREGQFRECANAKAHRWALGIAYMLLPRRISALPSILGLTLAGMVRGGTQLPKRGHAGAHGFVGVVRNTSPSTILSAYRLGFYAQSHLGPLKWWCHEQRSVLFLNERTIPHKLRKAIRKSTLRVTFDKAFDDVIKACAQPRPGRPRLTWITPSIMHLFAALHDQGHAHSFELWDDTGTLVGGGYGVAIGKVFVTESQFSQVRDASKIGFQVLNHHLATWGFVLNDIKEHAPHFDHMGFRNIPRNEYEAILDAHAQPHHDLLRPWKTVATLDEVAGGGVGEPQPVAAKRREKKRPAA